MKQIDSSGTTKKREKKDFNSAHVILVQNGKIVMGKDSWSKKLTLFGGKCDFKEKKFNNVNKKKRKELLKTEPLEKIEHTANRELFEETCTLVKATDEMLDRCKHFDIKNSNGRYDRVFILYAKGIKSEDFEKKYNKCKKKQKDKKYLEKTKIEFVPLKSLRLEYDIYGRIFGTSRINPFARNLVQAAIRHKII